MPVRCAILDDYQNVALAMADWSKVKADAEIKVFTEPFGSPEAAAKALAGFEIICAMRERTPFPRAMFEKLPGLKLLVTTGMRNASIDIAAAKDHGVTVCGTDSAGHPTAELTIGLMIDLARKISLENARMKAGEAWQATVGGDLHGKTLGILGLGRLGQRVARVGARLQHEGRGLEPESHAGEMQGSRGRNTRPRTSFFANPISSPSTWC